MADRLYILFLIPLALSGCATQTSDLTHPDYPRIKLPDSAIEIGPRVESYDSPVMSADGRRLAVQVELRRHRFLPYEVFCMGVAERMQEGDWSGLALIRHGVYKRYLGRMEQTIQPAFTEDGQSILVTYIEFDSVLSIPWLSSLRSWIEEIPFAGGEVNPVIEHHDWGFQSNELIQHARISPDGRWLTFYARVHLEDQGIYLLDRWTGKHYRLTYEHDKHPTFGCDGKRIWFHHSYGGKRHRFDFFTSGIERAVLGYVELTFHRGELVGWHRQLMDELGDQYLYHKHPTEIAGSGLVVFHGETEPDGKKRLFVRKTEPGSQVFEIMPGWADGKLKEYKHPCSSYTHPDLVFIAKEKGGERYDMLMELTPEAIEEMVHAVGEWTAAGDAVPEE